jgi:hypothetical protein
LYADNEEIMIRIMKAIFVIFTNLMDKAKQKE